MANPLGKFLPKLANLGQEWLLNIRTSGISRTDRPGAIYYASISYSEIRNVLCRLDLQRSDVFVDVGAGKGRVLCLAAQYRMHLVIGVEYSTELANIAKLNVIRMRGKRTPVEVHIRPAEEFDYSSATALYLFNPFEADILDIVLHKLNVDREGKAIRIAFVMESAPQKSVFLSHGWLKCYERWVDRSGHSNAIYRTA